MQGRARESLCLLRLAEETSKGYFSHYFEFIPSNQDVIQRKSRKLRPSWDGKETTQGRVCSGEIQSSFNHEVIGVKSHATTGLQSDDKTKTQRYGCRQLTQPKLQPCRSKSSMGRRCDVSEDRWRLDVSSHRNGLVFTSYRGMASK